MNRHETERRQRQHTSRQGEGEQDGDLGSEVIPQGWSSAEPGAARVSIERAEVLCRQGGDLRRGGGQRFRPPAVDEGLDGDDRPNRQPPPVPPNEVLLERELPP